MYIPWAASVAALVAIVARSKAIVRTVSDVAVRGEDERRCDATVAMHAIEIVNVLPSFSHCQYPGEKSSKPTNR